jgi:hypothetical protein
MIRPTRPSILIAALSIGLCALGSTSPAHADETQQVAVLAFASEAQNEQLSFEITERVRDEIGGTPGYELKPVRASLEQLSMVQDCDETSQDCLKQIASSLSVDALVLGTLTIEGTEALVVVQRFDVAAGRVLGEASASIASGRPEAPVVRERAKEIVDALFGRAVDDAMPAGAVVAAEDRSEQNAEADAAAERAELALESSPVPEPSGLSGRKIAAYSLLGVAALSTGLSVLSFVQIDRAEGNEAFDGYRKAVGTQNPSAKDVCEEADAGRRYGVSDKSFSSVRDQCSAGQTYEVLQFVFLGTALAAGGVSAYLFLSDDSGSEHASRAKAKLLAVRPTVGLRSAGLSARLRF